MLYFDKKQVIFCYSPRSILLKTDIEDLFIGDAFYIPFNKLGVTSGTCDKTDSLHSEDKSNPLEVTYSSTDMIKFFYRNGELRCKLYQMDFENRTSSGSFVSNKSTNTFEMKAELLSIAKIYDQGLESIRLLSARINAGDEPLEAVTNTIRLTRSKLHLDCIYHDTTENFLKYMEEKLKSKEKPKVSKVPNLGKARTPSSRPMSPPIINSGLRPRPGGSMPEI